MVLGKTLCCLAENFPKIIKMWYNESVASSRNEYQSVRELAQIAAEALSKEEK